jgi:hypothetical protein
LRPELRQAGKKIEPPGSSCEPTDVTDQAAYVLRENAGPSGLERSAREAVLLLAEHGIPHLIVGGFAVQEHGYPRVTIDVDIVVPDPPEAVEWITSNLGGPFFKVYGVEDRVEDRRNGVLIDLLPAGRVLKNGCKIPFPEPKIVAEGIRIVSLEDLISLKLDSWANSPVHRHRDKSDVIELIKSRNLSRDLTVNPAILELYITTWDALKSEERDEQRQGS